MKVDSLSARKKYSLYGIMNEYGRNKRKLSTC